MAFPALPLPPCPRVNDHSMQIYVLTFEPLDPIPVVVWLRIYDSKVNATAVDLFIYVFLESFSVTMKPRVLKFFDNTIVVPHGLKLIED